MPQDQNFDCATSAPNGPPMVNGIYYGDEQSTPYELHATGTTPFGDANQTNPSAPSQVPYPAQYPLPFANANPYGFVQPNNCYSPMPDPALNRTYLEEQLKLCSYAAKKNLEVEADLQKAENRAKISAERDKCTIEAFSNGAEIFLRTCRSGDHDTLGKLPCPTNVKMLIPEGASEKILAVCFSGESGDCAWYFLHQSNWTPESIKKLFLIGGGKSFLIAKPGIKRSGYDALLQLLISLANRNTVVIPVSYGWQGYGTELRRVVRGRDQVWKEVVATCR